MSVKEKWNDRYRSVDDEPASASQVLHENCHLLPETGHALDLACGRGGNALLLARRGLQVQAWDVSDVVIEKLQKQTKELSLSIEAEVRDVELHPPDPSQFDVIVVSYFLDRNIMPALMRALKPGGLIFYQTFSQDRISERGPQSDAFRLGRQELLQLFSALDVIVYREECLLGDTRTGCRDEVMYIGRKSI